MLNALCAIRIGKEITNPNSTTFTLHSSKKMVPAVVCQCKIINKKCVDPSYKTDP
jgi:hypothetical protein